MNGVLKAQSGGSFNSENLEIFENYGFDNLIAFIYDSMNPIIFNKTLIKNNIMLTY